MDWYEVPTPLATSGVRSFDFANDGRTLLGGILTGTAFLAENLAPRSLLTGTTFGSLTDLSRKATAHARTSFNIFARRMMARLT